MFARQPVFAHKLNSTFEQRCNESARDRERYSDRLPVIVERAPSSEIAAVDKCAAAATRHALTASCARPPAAPEHDLIRWLTRSDPLLSPQVQVFDSYGHDDGPTSLRA